MRKIKAVVGSLKGMTRFVAVVLGLFLCSGIVEAVDIDILGSRMEVVNSTTMTLRGVNVGPQTYWAELLWEPNGNVFALTGKYGLEPWKVHPPMPTPGYWSASAVWDSKLYVIGGSNRYDAVEAYDPVSRIWNSRKRFNVGFLLRAVTVGNTIYVLGSMSSSANKFWKYDPSQDAWTALPQPPTPQWVSELAEVGGKIYVFGGVKGSAVNEVWEYDTGLGTWTSKAPMPTARYGSSTAVVNGKIYVFGGNYGSKVAEVYDPAANSWQVLSPLPFTTFGWDVAAPSGNRIVVVEAEKGASALYNPATNSWEPGEPMLTPRGNYITGDALLDSVYVAGGYVDGTAVNRLESYNPSAPRSAVPTRAPTLGFDRSEDGALYSAEHERRHLALQALLQAGYGQ